MTTVTYVIDRNALDFVLNGPGGPVAQVVARIAQNIANLAKQYVPVDTGRLRSSITWQLTVDQRGIGAVIGTNVEYARYVEQGTYRMAAQPYLVPALIAERVRLGG